jgi:hypothetical protein
MAEGVSAPCHACAVGNVTLPTPVFVAGGALSLLAGYLIGVVAGPDTPDRTTATVVSFDPTDNRLCLGGDGVKDVSGVDDQGHLCGTWRRTSGSVTPGRGDRFRFVTLVDRDPSSGATATRTVIYGNVVG